MVSLTDFDLRYEMATADTPRTAVPSFRDLTASVRAADTINLRRGRQNEQDAGAQPGSATTSLLNPTGAFTMGNTGSPYAPLQLRRPCRYRVRYGTAAGNLFAAEDASFEGGTIGSWRSITFGYISPALTNDATHVASGTKAMLITWPAAVLQGSAATISVSGLTIDRKYTISASIWVPVGNPAVRLTDPFGSVAGSPVAPAGFSSSTSTTGTFQRIALTFTALAPSGFLSLMNLTASTAGQQAWVDGVMLDDGTTVGTFTTTPPPIYDLWSGFVDDWGNRRDETTGIARIPASDRLARAAANNLKAAIDAEILSDSPDMFYPLDDAAGATGSGNRTGVPGAPALSVLQMGSGGTLTTGSGTAPGPDGGSTLLLTPASSVNGKYLGTTTDFEINGGITGYTQSVFVMPAALGTAMGATHGYTGTLGLDRVTELGINSAGKAIVAVAFAAGTINLTLTGATTLPLTSFTHLAVTHSAPVASTVTVRLYVNGVQEASGTYTAPFTLNVQRVNVGAGALGLFSGPWNGQLSRAAFWKRELTAARILDHANAINGWTGETTAARFTRLCRTSGLPSTMYATGGTGMSTMGFQPTAGQSLLSALKTVAEAENGIVFVDKSGDLQFQARSVRYNPASGLTLDASKPGHVSKDAEVVTDTALLVNDATVNRPNGATTRVVDQASVDNYDLHDQTVTLYVDTDVLVQASAEWSVYTNSTPEQRIGEITIDVVAFANNGGNVAQLLGAEISTRVTVTVLPSDTSATSTLDLFVEGINHQISKSQWLMVLSTSPLGQSGGVMVLDDTTFGRLDLGGILAY